MPRPRFEKLDPEKRRRILDVATTEFAENGFDGSSYNRIIEKAGLSKGAMYYYFDDKTDLFVTVLKRAFQKALDEFPNILQGDRSFWEELEAIYVGWIGFAAQHPEIVAMGRQVAKLPARARVEGPLAELYETMADLTGGVIKQGQDAGAIRKDVPFELLVNLVFSMGEVTDMWILEHMEEIREQGIDEFARLLVGMSRRMAEPPEDEQ